MNLFMVHFKDTFMVCAKSTIKGAMSAVFNFFSFCVLTMKKESQKILTLYFKGDLLFKIIMCLNFNKVFECRFVSTVCKQLA